MKASRVFLILVIVAVLAVLIKEGQPLPFPPVARPAVVEARLTENAKKLKGTIRFVEKGTLVTVENEQRQETELYDARIAVADGKVWRVKILADGRVIEVDEQRTARIELFGIPLKWPGWD